MTRALPAIYPVRVRYIIAIHADEGWRQLPDREFNHEFQALAFHETMTAESVVVALDSRNVARVVYDANPADVNRILDDLAGSGLIWS